MRRNRCCWKRGARHRSIRPRDRAVPLLFLRPSPGRCARHRQRIPGGGARRPGAGLRQRAAREMEARFDASVRFYLFASRATPTEPPFGRTGRRPRRPDELRRLDPQDRVGGAVLARVLARWAATRMKLTTPPRRRGAGPSWSRHHERPGQADGRRAARRGAHRRRHPAVTWDGRPIACADCRYASLREAGRCEPGRTCLQDRYARRIDRFFRATRSSAPTNWTIPTSRCVPSPCAAPTCSTWRG